MSLGVNMCKSLLSKVWNMYTNQCRMNVCDVSMVSWKNKPTLWGDSEAEEKKPVVLQNRPADPSCCSLQPKRKKERKLTVRKYEVYLNYSPADSDSADPLQLLFLSLLCDLSPSSVSPSFRFSPGRLYLLPSSRWLTLCGRSAESLIFLLPPRLTVTLRLS